jgi:peptide/nickel transport system substrate-binding protein
MLTKIARTMVVLLVSATIAASCSPPSPTISQAPPVPSFAHRGGTLRVAAVGDLTLDPQRADDPVSMELLKCCLLRTLYSTNGSASGQGGTSLQPDLAAGPPTVSSDGLTWTFSIKSGLQYAPPLGTVTITSGDIVRALEREADPSIAGVAYQAYFAPILGFQEFSDGRASTISGLATPDDQTLVVTLTRPIGDLGWRMSLPAAAPIPPASPGGKSAILGAAAGHGTDYSRYLIASGPYMIDGSASLDPSKAAARQAPVSGFVPGRSLHLVRDPSWRQSGDPLRPAYAGEVDVNIGGDPAVWYAKVSAGSLDLVMGADPPQGVVDAYATDPTLQNRLFLNPLNTVDYVAMNLAVPPFDDVHIRRALNWLVDKSGAVQLAGGVPAGTAAAHVFPDQLLGGALMTYGRFGTPSDAGDLSKAKAEMTQSKYAGADGMCDAAACKNVLALTQAQDPWPSIGALWKQDLAQIGITLDVRPLRGTLARNRCADPAQKIPLCLSASWSALYPDAAPLAEPLFSSAGLYPACCNSQGFGASAADLQRWGITATSMPNLDDRLARCEAIAVTSDRWSCWADLDRYLMEQVVPWVPWMIPQQISPVSSHVTNFSFDQLTGMPAIDHVATDGTG